MSMRTLMPAVLTALVPLLALSDAPAASDTLRTSFVKDRPANVDVAKDGIRVANYRFDRLTRGGANPFKMGAGPSIVFNVKNEGTDKRDFGIAVALFDPE